MKHMITQQSKLFRQIECVWLVPNFCFLSVLSGAQVALMLVLQLIQVPRRHKQVEYNPCFTSFVTYFHLVMYFLGTSVPHKNVYLAPMDCSPLVRCWVLGILCMMWWKSPRKIKKNILCLYWKFTHSCKYFDPLVMTVGSRNLILMKTSN